jgi:hypothetical protein
MHICVGLEIPRQESHRAEPGGEKKHPKHHSYFLHLPNTDGVYMYVQTVFKQLSIRRWLSSAPSLIALMMDAVRTYET